MLSKPAFSLGIWGQHPNKMCRSWSKLCQCLPPVTQSTAAPKHQREARKGALWRRLQASGGSGGAGSNGSVVRPASLRQDQPLHGETVPASGQASSERLREESIRGSQPSGSRLRLLKALALISIWGPTGCVWWSLRAKAAPLRTLIQKRTGKIQSGYVHWASYCIKICRFVEDSK